MSKFEAQYGIDDGYVGESIKTFTIDEVDIEDDMTDEALNELFDEIMQEDFAQNVSPYGKNKEEFIQWARERIKQMEV